MRWWFVTMVMAAGCGRLSFAPLADSDAGSGSGSGSSAPELDAAPAADAIAGATDCRTMHIDSPALPDGIYDLDLDGIGPHASVAVYCDMTTAGGGWTLVARSAAGGSSTTWGWKGQSGSLDDDTKPYSMGPPAQDIGFSELLLAAHAGTKTPAIQAYVIPTGGNFIASHGQTSLRSQSTTVLGTCSPTSSVEMFLFKGQTDLSDVFWFRDFDFVGPEHYGLLPDQWSTYWNDCNRGGSLDDQQGVIYVR